MFLDVNIYDLNDQQASEKEDSFLKVENFLK